MPRKEKRKRAEDKQMQIIASKCLKINNIFQPIQVNQTTLIKNQNECPVTVQVTDELDQVPQPEPLGFCGVEPEKKSMDTSNAEVQNVSLDSISTASSSWSFATDYDLANESRLLNFNNASNEKLVNSSCYKLDYDDEGKYIEVGYSTYLQLTPVIRIWNSSDYNGVCAASGPYNTHYNDREKNNVLLTIDEWNTLMNLQSHLMNVFFRTPADAGYRQEFVDVNDGPFECISKTSDISRDLKIIYTTEYRPDLGWSECNNNGFVNTICLTRDYKNCILNKWDVDCMFGLKDIINYRLELMQSYKLDVVFNGVIKRMVIELDKVKKKKTLEQTINDGDDWGVYEMFEKLINSKYNINSHNVLCLMEVLYRRPGFIMSHVVENMR
ncbi:hypothetical protein FQR65_LT18239 [Abscondita terminalis]|nr:hypothetical protein FQR65_LT18239 [Abscondita terminalis]